MRYRNDNKRLDLKQLTGRPLLLRGGSRCWEAIVFAFRCPALEPHVRPEAVPRPRR